VFAGFSGLLLLIASARCSSTKPATRAIPSAVLRVGVGQIGVDTLISNLTIEGLTVVGDNGRVKPWLAKSWSTSPDGLSLTLSLRPGATFHDGSLVAAPLVVDILKRTMGRFAGPAFDDVASIEAASANDVHITLKQPSQFFLEALETSIQKPGAPTVGTGPFAALTPNNRSAVVANSRYYLGAPAISKIDIAEYPSDRAAWADMLRDNLDMVYDVGLDALDSLQTSTKINVYSVIRHYQFVILLNLKSKETFPAPIRRALNNAIDRPVLVRDGMAGHGVPSRGPIWPTHWAAQGSLPTFAYDPKAAARDIAATGKTVPGAPQFKFQFTCLVAPDAERVALVAKKQLEAVGVNMILREASADELRRAATQGQFEAIVTSVISGPSIFRPYLWWDSKGSLNRTGYSNRSVDSALDTVRHAISDEEYSAGVEAFQRSILLDPPAVFLAWDERARAVNNRFDVAPQPGIDIIRTLHLWRPVAGAGKPDNN
jgi:ABC-type transport system substrate-binding protein